MNPASEGASDYRAQRRRGILFIAVGTMPAAALWWALYRWLSPLDGMDQLSARLAVALKCLSLATLFTLALGIEAVAHERLRSPAFDPLSGFETRRMRVNARFLQNTLEQLAIFAVGFLGLAAYCEEASAMRAVPATAAAWTVGRLFFWIGYHRSAAARGLGASSMIIGLGLLLYVGTRFAYDLAGLPGAASVLTLFSLAEAGLFWWTRPARPELVARAQRERNH